MEYPTVSAICITERRPHLLQRAIACFHAQQYPSKELVILFPKSDLETAALVENLSHPSIKVITTDVPLKLGEKRNFAVAESSGEFFCSWDDDDWNHPLRLMEQVTCVQHTGKIACTLEHILLCNMVSGEVHLSFNRPWEATLLCSRHVFSQGFAYGKFNRGEDSVLVQALLDRDMIAMHHNPLLYVYNFHGENVSGKDHWDTNIFKHGKALPQEANELVLRIQENEDVITLSHQMQPFIDDLIA